jgi:hypothetical protein
MIVLRLNIKKENRTEETSALLKGLSSYLSKELGLEEIKVISDKELIELSSKPYNNDDIDNPNDLISVELMISKNMVINNSNVEQGLEIIKSQLNKVIKV